MRVATSGCGHRANRWKVPPPISRAGQRQAYPRRECRSSRPRRRHLPSNRVRRPFGLGYVLRVERLGDVEDAPARLGHTEHPPHNCRLPRLYPEAARGDLPHPSQNLRGQVLAIILVHAPMIASISLPVGEPSACSVMDTTRMPRLRSIDLKATARSRFLVKCEKQRQCHEQQCSQSLPGHKRVEQLEEPLPAGLVAPVFVIEAGEGGLVGRGVLPYN